MTEVLQVEQPQNKRDKRARGTGGLYQPDGTPNWYIKYYKNDGTPVRESAKTTDKDKAEKFLRKRLAEVLTSTYTGPSVEKIKVDELVDDLLREYKVNGRKSYIDTEGRWRLHLKPYFGLRRAVSVTSSLIDAYVDRRQRENPPASNATVNRELALLKRAFNLGIQGGKINHIPHFPHLHEDNVRIGFLEDEQYQKLADQAAKTGLWMKSIFECAYRFGFRKAELVNMRCRQIDPALKTIRLEVGTTKSGAGRLIVYAGIPALETLLSACVIGKSPDDYVFTRENGQGAGDFRDSWVRITKAAGLPNLLFHDLRRSAVRNLVRAGVPEVIAMKISGHRTRSVFDRYDIVTEGDLRDAAVKIGARFGPTLVPTLEQAPVIPS